jgi:hypothetical protein
MIERKWELCGSHFDVVISCNILQKLSVAGLAGC